MKKKNNYQYSRYGYTVDIIFSENNKESEKLLKQARRHVLEVLINKIKQERKEQIKCLQ